MRRPCRAPVLAAVLAVFTAGCQDYNFNPVGHCLLQPGSERFTLSSVSTADVLFVVDDSGSMSEEQAALAANFNRFIDNLNDTNVTRGSGGLQPIDFHIAVTTTAVYWNFETVQTCRSDCTGAGGQKVCCVGQTPVRKPKRCTSDAQCSAAVAGTSCRLNCSRLQGEFYCCNTDGSIPAAEITAPNGDFVPCAVEGLMCGSLETHYDFQGCSNQIGQNQWPYPQGEFVSWSATPGTTLPNPRVLHFDKSLYPRATACAAGCPVGQACDAQAGVCRATCGTCPAGYSCETGLCQPQNLQGYTSAQLVNWFTQNVRVGTCGSGQEQALQAGRLAVQKAFAGKQKDTRTSTGANAWTAPTQIQLNGPTAAARWPNANSKLVVVFVGDEDDCSSPQDPSGGVVMLPEGPNVDACTRDATTDPPLGHKEFPVSQFVSYFTGLGRPVGAAFILPAAQNSCTLATCTASGLCGTAQARGPRLLAAAQGLAAAGVDVVAGSICDSDFGTLLDQIAEIVKPPQTLSLPSRPAESAIALLRIASGNGDTRKLCGRPLAPGPATLAAAQATGADWWFTATAEPGVPVNVSQFVYINPQGTCIANPGETYSADYIGVLPAPDGCASSQECVDKLGGTLSQWTCSPIAGMAKGTCTCTGTGP